MKATLEFDLPAEKPDLDMVLIAGEMHSALAEIDHILRNCLKHDGDAKRAMQACREIVNDTIYRNQ